MDGYAVGDVVNGYRWTGTEWVRHYAVGEEANGYRWSGTQWELLPPPPQVVVAAQPIYSADGAYWWNGAQWLPNPQKEEDDRVKRWAIGIVAALFLLFAVAFVWNQVSQNNLNDRLEQATCEEFGGSNC